MLIKVLSIALFVLLSSVTIYLTSLYIKIRLAKELKDESETKILVGKELYALMGISAVVSLAAGLLIYDNTTSLLSFYKIIFIYLTTSVIAVTDVKLRIIPNIITLILLLGGVVFHLIDIFIRQDKTGIVSQILIYNVIASVIVVIILWVLSLVTRNGMGFGDIKYLGALCFTGGITLLLVSLSVSLICSLVVGVTYVARKKKKMKDTIPFGPFILLGVVACIFTGLM
ncbi:prepilin peptidase [Ruminococcus sp. JE7B6]|uniref:prepilin peptidase n=1 Tax=Ruminococcus sp. JE7B6 TaxID=3233380 RepID=UPI00389A3C35